MGEGMYEEPRDWLRQENETTAAYEAFRVYLRHRSQSKVAAEVQKSTTIISKWCARHQWVARSVAYDRYLDQAKDDGLVDQLASVREKHIVLADKLLDHLSNQLDTSISRREDPTIRWTTAFTAAIKAHQGAFLMKDHERTTETLNTAMDLIQRLEQAQDRETS